MFLTIDKSSDIALVYKSDYQEKLVSLFMTENFEKVKRFNLEEEKSKYSSFLKQKLSKNLSEETFSKIGPNNSISDGFGLLKCHKMAIHLEV